MNVVVEMQSKYLMMLKYNLSNVKFIIIIIPAVLIIDEDEVFYSKELSEPALL
jgi:hypothetical protein